MNFPTRKAHQERFQAELLAAFKHPNQSNADALHDQLSDLRDTLETLQFLLLSSTQDGEINIPEKHFYGFLNLLKNQVNAAVAFANVVASTTTDKEAV